MKRSELKKVLKPLIKECIKEVIFEEGVLSGLITEVVQGLQGQSLLSENQQPSPPPQKSNFERPSVEFPAPDLEESLNERKRKLEASMGSQFAGILDETTALSQGGSLNESKVQSPLAVYGPNDAGVDISGLMQLAGGKNWKHMI